MTFIHFLLEYLYILSYLRWLADLIWHVHSSFFFKSNHSFAGALRQYHILPRCSRFHPTAVAIKHFCGCYSPFPTSLWIHCHKDNSKNVHVCFLYNPINNKVLSTKLCALLRFYCLLPEAYYLSTKSHDGAPHAQLLSRVKYKDTALVNSAYQICIAWSESVLFVVTICGFWIIEKSQCGDSVQSAQMRGLFRVFTISSSARHHVTWWGSFNELSRSGICFS